MKKIFKKKNVYFYLIYYLIVEFFTKFSLIRGIVSYVLTTFELAIESPNFFVFIKAFVVLVLMFLLWLLLVVLITAPVTIWILASKTVDNIHERQNKNFTTKENLIYYRDKLNHISPIMISFLENLKVEEEKDFVATVMKIQLNKNILIQNNKIQIISNDTTNLSLDEQKIFYMISNNSYNRKDFEDWKRIIINEAKKRSLIKEKNPTIGLFIKRLILVVVFILFILGIYYLIDDVPNSINELEKMGITENTEIIEILKINNFNYYLESVVKACVLIICMVGTFGWPIFYVVFVVKYQNINNALKRTEKGEQLTNLILGLKNFIHDFSNLNEEKKDALYLWDDFLVYAVLLEENKTIVNEILSIREIELINKDIINIK